MTEEDLKGLTHEIIGAAMKVHSELGPGLLENVYETCLAYELNKNGLKAVCQIAIPINYGEVKLDVGLRLDMLVNDSVVVELKVAEHIMSVHKSQLLSYLRMAKKKVGLLLNFNVVHMRDGIYRLIN